LKLIQSLCSIDYNIFEISVSLYVCINNATWEISTAFSLPSYSVKSPFISPKLQNIHNTNKCDSIRLFPLLSYIHLRICRITMIIRSRITGSGACLNYGIRSCTLQHHTVPQKAHYSDYGKQMNNILDNVVEKITATFLHYDSTDFGSRHITTCSHLHLSIISGILLFCKYRPCLLSFSTPPEYSVC